MDEREQADIRELMCEIRDYLDQRSDADQPDPSLPPIPNTEMRLLMELDRLLPGYGKLMESKR